MNSQESDGEGMDDEEKPEEIKYQEIDYEEINHAEIKKKTTNEVEEQKEHDTTKMNGQIGVPITRRSSWRDTVGNRKPPIKPNINRSKSYRETSEDNKEDIRQSIRRRSSFIETLNEDMKQDLRKRYSLWETNKDNKQVTKSNIYRSKSFKETIEDTKQNTKYDIVRRYSFRETDQNNKQEITIQADKQDFKRNVRRISNNLNFPQDSKRTLLNNRPRTLLDIRRINNQDNKQIINQDIQNVTHPNINQARSVFNHQNERKTDENGKRNQGSINSNRDGCNNTRDSFLSLNSYEGSVQDRSGAETDDTLVNVKWNGFQFDLHCSCWNSSMAEVDVGHT